MHTQTQVREHMTRYPLVVTPSTTVKDALELMRAYRIRHLPVTRGQSIVGVVSERDLGKVVPFLGTCERDEFLVENFMVRDPYVARPYAPLAEVTAAMASQKYGCTVVLGPEDAVLGIFTTTDALHLLTRLLIESKGCNAAYTRLDDWLAWDSSMGE